MNQLLSLLFASRVRGNYSAAIGEYFQQVGKSDRTTYYERWWLCWSLKIWTELSKNLMNCAFIRHLQFVSLMCKSKVLEIQNCTRTLWMPCTCARCGYTKIHKFYDNLSDRCMIKHCQSLADSLCTHNYTVYINKTAACTEVGRSVNGLDHMRAVAPPC